MKVTVAEFANAQGVSTSAADGFITFIVDKGKATNTGEMRGLIDTDGKPKRGRPSAIFELPDSVTLDLS